MVAVTNIGLKKLHLVSYGVGMVHGLAGSGELLLLVMLQMTSVQMGMLYLLIFGIGSILGMLVAAAGLVAGVAVTGVVAILFARMIAGVLYRVSVGDPFSWIGAAALLLAVSALANLIPAWRASRVDPSAALRIE